MTNEEYKANIAAQINQGSVNLLIAQLASLLVERDELKAKLDELTAAPVASN